MSVRIHYCCDFCGGAAIVALLQKLFKDWKYAVMLWLQLGLLHLQPLLSFCPGPDVVGLRSQLFFPQAAKSWSFLIFKGLHSSRDPTIQLGNHWKWIVDPWLLRFPPIWKELVLEFESSNRRKIPELVNIPPRLRMHQVKLTQDNDHASF